MSFEELLEDMGSKTAKVLTGTYRLHVDGLLSAADFQRTAVDILGLAEVQARTRGAAAYAEAIAEELQRTAQLKAPVTAQQVSTRAGLSQSVSTILTSDANTLMQLDRLAQVLIYEAAQLGYDEQLDGDGTVEGWFRELNSDACQLCVWWWREGQLWEKERPLQTHKGCRCRRVAVQAGDDGTTSSVHRAIHEKNEQTAAAQLQREEERV